MEQSSTGSWRGGQGKGKKILMMTLKTRTVDLGGLRYGIERNTYCVSDFHMVDLEHNEISLCCFPSLVIIVPPSDILSLDEFVYIVGGVAPCMTGIRHLNIHGLQSESPVSNRTYYFGGSRIDSSDEAAVWCPAPAFINDQSFFSGYVSFLGKIYSFGRDCLNPEVLDPAADGYPKPISPLPIPEDLVGCGVSTPLPDPSKNRILVRLHGGQLSSPSLYAFTPDIDGVGTWTLLIRDFSEWTRCVAVVDDIIYFYSHKFPRLLRAFHIAEEKWLEVCWDSCFKGNSNFNVTKMHFDALLHLGDNILCFAVWTHIYPEPVVHTLSVVFYKFEVLQDPDGTIRLHACDSYSYHLPENQSVISFISL